MSEADTISALAAVGDTTSSDIALWVTTTFGYLTVAYFIGKDLTRFQVGAVTGLYIVSSTLFSMSAIAHSETSLAMSDGTAYESISFYEIATTVFWIRRASIRNGNGKRDESKA